jgi:hypothetical protein
MKPRFHIIWDPLGRLMDPPPDVREKLGIHSMIIDIDNFFDRSADDRVRWLLHTFTQFTQVLREAKDLLREAPPTKENDECP